MNFLANYYNIYNSWKVVEIPIRFFKCCSTRKREQFKMSTAKQQLQRLNGRMTRQKTVLPGHATPVLSVSLANKKQKKKLAKLVLVGFFQLFNGMNFWGSNILGFNPNCFNPKKIWGSNTLDWNISRKSGSQPALKVWQGWEHLKAGTQHQKISWQLKVTQKTAKKCVNLICLC